MCLHSCKAVPSSRLTEPRNFFLWSLRCMCIDIHWRNLHRYLDSNTDCPDTRQYAYHSASLWIQPCMCSYILQDCCDMCLESHKVMRGIHQCRCYSTHLSNLKYMYSWPCYCAVYMLRCVGKGLVDKRNCWIDSGHLLQERWFRLFNSMISIKRFSLHSENRVFFFQNSKEQRCFNRPHPKFI